MRSCVVAVVCLCAVGPGEILHAQRLISLGLAGGASIPQGDLRDAANTGWHALGTVVVSSTMQPLGLRLDVAYNRFEFNDATAATIGNGYQTVLSATANATYRLPMTDSPLSPYLVSGLGAYRSECSVADGCEDTTRYGWNIGLGTKLLAFRWRSFIEARYHRTSIGDRTVQYFPVTFGLLF